MKELIPYQNHNRYIPKLIKQRLDIIEYPRKENLYCIIDMIYRRNIYFKNDAQKQYGYIPIALKHFKEILGKAQNVVDDIKFLIENGLIERREAYSVELKISKSYRIPLELLSKKTIVSIQNKKINEKISKQIQRMKVDKEETLAFQQTHYFNTFRIDAEAAILFLEQKAKDEIKHLCSSLKIYASDTDIENLMNCSGPYQPLKQQLLSRCNRLSNIMHSFLINTSRVNSIRDGFLYFKRNKTNHRLDSNLTTLPNCLKQFIIWDEELYNIDLKSSQPFFLYTIIKDEPSINTEELELYRSLVVSGSYQDLGIYEYLSTKSRVYFGKHYTRDKVKQMLFKIFYSQNKSYKLLKDFFREHFPTINSFIEGEKVHNHNAFAIRLQKMESKIVLDEILPLLEKENISPYTVHDSFVCSKSEVDIVTKTIVNVMETKLGASPNLHVDCITKNHEDEEPNEWMEIFEELPDGSMIVSDLWLCQV